MLLSYSQNTFVLFPWVLLCKKKYKQLLCLKNYSFVFSDNLLPPRSLPIIFATFNYSGSFGFQIQNVTKVCKKWCSFTYFALLILIQFLERCSNDKWFLGTILHLPNLFLENIFNMLHSKNPNIWVLLSKKIKSYWSH